MGLHSSHPAQRLEHLSLGLAAATATTAGLSLPQKAEATISLGPSGIIVSDDAVTALTFLNIHLDLANDTAPIVVGSYSTQTRGWNLIGNFYGTYFDVTFVDRTGSGADGIYTYFFLNPNAAGFSLYSTSQLFNLATIDISNFSDNSSYFRISTNDTWFIGLRRVSSLGADINGWVQVQFGSVTHLQSAFNFDNPSSIAIGQIPEPTSALLLAAGSGGLLAARRRRKKAA